MKKNIVVGLQAFALATSLAAVPAFASTTSQSAASAKSVAPRLMDKLSVGLVSYFNGPALGDVSAYRTNESGERDLTSPQNFVNALGVAYKLSSERKVGVTFPFNYQPVVGQSLTFKNPYLKASDSAVYKKGIFTLDADLRVYIPAMKSSRDMGFITGVRSTQGALVEIPNSRLSVGTYTYARFNIYSVDENSIAGAEDLYMYIGPHVDYQISPKLSTSVLFNAETKHPFGNSLGFTGWVKEGVSLEPSLNWQATPALSLSPYLSVPTHNMSLNATTLNMLIIGTIL